MAAQSPDSSALDSVLSTTVTYHMFIFHTGTSPVMFILDIRTLKEVSAGSEFVL